MTQTSIVLKPKDTVRVKDDTGEYYAEFPSQVILVATRGSVGRIVSLDEFKADFIRRLGQQDFRQAQPFYQAHFAVVEQAMSQGLQYPIRFEQVKEPSSMVDLVRSRPHCIELVDGVAVEKMGGGGALDQVAAFLGQSSPKAIAGKIVWPAADRVHDQDVFTDPELVIAMAHGGPVCREDIEIVYLRHTSKLSYHNLWYRLKQVAGEAAFDIIDTLRFPKHNHAGCSWKDIADMLEKNDPRKPLWYTLDQQEALIVAAQNIYQWEKEPGGHAGAN